MTDPLPRQFDLSTLATEDIAGLLHGFAEHHDAAPMLSTWVDTVLRLEMRRRRQGSEFESVFPQNWPNAELGKALLLSYAAVQGGIGSLAATGFCDTLHLHCLATAVRRLESME